MSTDNRLAESPTGYLSEGSKRRFTVIAGTLGAAFFLAQFLLPMLVMLLVMMPMMLGRAVSTPDLDNAAAWQGDLWFVERTTHVDWHDPGRSTQTLALKHLRLSDLSAVGSEQPLEASRGEAVPALLPIGNRLWLLNAGSADYYTGGTLTHLSGVTRPHRASRPFAYQGRPAIVSRGMHPTLAVLEGEGSRTQWKTRPFPLALPTESGSLRSLQAVEAGGGLYLFAELCTEEPEHCSLSYREPGREAWFPLAEDACSCGSWTALALESQPTVVLSEQDQGRDRKLEAIAVTPDGPRSKRIALGKGERSWGGWRALPLQDHILLVSGGMPVGLSLLEAAEGRIVRSVRTEASLPFGPNMMVFMMIPQFLPIALSLLLALLLTGQMRRHRIQDYVFDGTRRRFASLWQRALAQLVDILPLGAGFLLPLAWVWRAVSDPETLAESGPMFPLWFFGLFVAAFVSGMLVLVSFSYFEGRFGKTPGKWLVGIRVLGTDLQPCGFGRALLRNLLTFIDGFFNFLVGALLVALTEHWQRLGDLAARTIVLVDEKKA